MKLTEKINCFCYAFRAPALAMALFGGMVYSVLSIDDWVHYKEPRETVVSVAKPDSKTKNVIYFQIEEFGDMNQTEWVEKDKKDGTIVGEFKEPEKYTAEKWNAALNPKFTSDSKIDPRLEERVVFGRDNINYMIVSDPKDVFSYLKKYNGPRLDRIIVSCHGSNTELCQNTPYPYSVGKWHLSWNYNKEDFSHVMTPSGQILLLACGTNKDYETKYTIAEQISDLFQVPVTGAIDTAVEVESGIHGPSHRRGIGEKNGRTVWGAEWFDEKGRADVERKELTPFVTVYPGNDN